jgi:hypothetical protein
LRSQQPKPSVLVDWKAFGDKTVFGKKERIFPVRNHKSSGIADLQEMSDITVESRSLSDWWQGALVVGGDTAAILRKRKW